MKRAWTLNSNDRPIVTAVGRLLRPKGAEPQIHHVIKVKPDGTVKTVIKEQYFTTYGEYPEA